MKEVANYSFALARVQTDSIPRRVENNEVVIHLPTGRLYLVNITEYTLHIKRQIAPVLNSERD